MVGLLSISIALLVLIIDFGSKCSKCNAFALPSLSLSPVAATTEPFSPLYAISSSSIQNSGSSNSNKSGSCGIKITGIPGGQVQSLPEMYVKSFRRWIVEGEIEHFDDETDTTTSVLKVEPIMGSGTLDSSYENISNRNNLLNDDDNNEMMGWVNPTSINLLWWPRDLPTLQTRPMINALFRNGVLSYVSAGLDVRVPHRKTSTFDGKNVSTWRNHGLNSQPIARQWTTLDVAMETLFHFEGFVVFDSKAGGEDDTDQNVQDGSIGSHTIQYETLFPSLNVQGALETFARLSAELDPSSPLASGFHIVSIPMVKHWTDLPKVYHENIDDDINVDEVIAYKIICIATSEPFASKLLDLDEDLLTVTSSSVLEVDVSRIAEGGASKYLRNPYRELYLGDKERYDSKNDG